MKRPSSLTGVMLLLATLLVAAPGLAQDDAAPAQQVEAAEPAEPIDAATEPVQEPEPVVLREEVQDQLRVWDTALDGIESGLASEDVSLDGLTTLRDRVLTTRSEVAAFLDGLRPALQEQTDLLASVTPQEGAVIETPQIIDLRARILMLEAQIQPAEVVLGRAEVLRSDIASRRTEAFTTQLLAQSASLLNPALWQEGFAALPATFTAFNELAATSWQSVKERSSNLGQIALIAALVLVLALALPARRWALRRSLRKEGHAASTLEKAHGAARIVLASAGVPVIGFGILLVALDTVGGLSPRAQNLLSMLAVQVTLYFLIAGLTRAILAPARPGWRMVPVEDGYAERAAAFIRTAAFVYSLGQIVTQIARAFFAALASVQITGSLAALLAALAVLVAMRAVLRGLKARQSDEDTPSLGQILWRWTIPIAALAAIIILIALLFGYLALAAFVMDRLAWTAMVLAALHVGALWVEQVLGSALKEEARTAQWVQDNIGLPRASLGQFGVLASGLIKLIFIIAAGAFIIAPFGLETAQITEILGSVFTGIEVGGFSFSLTSVFVAFALLFLGILITRGVQGWLERSYLPRTSIDSGLQSSISTGLGYVGIIIAAAVGLSYLGLNLENIALVAGALSVGIGFGLQSIVSNFVSGLILLAERPFKQGDWIVVGEEQGIVKRINVRATELQTFDRATVLIPNSDFIAGSVKNRVHRDTLGRIDVPVGVGYDSDPQKVKALLLEIANAHPQTLSYPEPAAFFVEFGASSLDFMLFAYLADVGNGYGVRSDIRFEIFRRFKEEGIDIPFAQSDVTIRNLDQVLAAMAKAGVAPPEGLGAGGLDAGEADKQSGVRTVPAPEPQTTPMVSSAAELRAGRRIDPDGDGKPSDVEGPEDGPAGKA